MIRSISTLFLLVFFQIGVAANGESTPSAGESQKTQVEKAADLQAFEFGVAIGLENYRTEYVNEAKVVGDNRIVRVTDSYDTNASVWLDTHYTWDGWAAGKGFTHSAPGFYVGVRLLGENSDFFDAFTLGVMWAFKRTRLGDDKSDSAFDSINIGIGPVWHRTRELANGIVEGESLPDEFDNVEYRKNDEISWMLIVSTGF